MADSYIYGREKLSFKLLIELYAVFFKIGLFTFGGGLAMLPMLTDELSIKRGWVNRDELVDYFAIGQCTPGIIAVNVATFVGYKKQGVIGGVIATLGMVAPSIIVISLLALFFSNFADAVTVRKAFSGINIAVAALLTKVVFTFIKKAVHSVFHAAVCAAAFVAAVFFRVHTAWIIAAALFTGTCVYLYERRKVRRGASPLEGKNK
ncbi:chromate transporter [Treponema sp. OMZ 840]|uniref:chromate transporter n=1 Tax=Treponema sp. OMZ 840 TaxID=244313 RepID=UPI003D8AB7E1